MPTVLHRLAQWAKEEPQCPAQRYKKSGSWQTITAREYCDRMYHLALFLESRGFGSNDVSCIFAPNSPEWVHTDFAALLLRMKSAGLYPNSNAKDIHYILNHTEARFLAVHNAEYFRRITADEASKAILDRISLILVFDGDTSISPKAVSYQAALQDGARLADSGAKPLQAYLDRIDPNAPAFMIYTSGTTGNPKGALLSHDNLVFTTDMVSLHWGLPMGNEELFSFLPLCHIAEQLHNIGVGLCRHYCVSFCTKFENVSVELPEVQPTLLLSVPRLWEKMMDGVTTRVRNGAGVKKALAIWGLEVGERVGEAKYSEKMANPLDLIQYLLADKLVLSKIRQALGLGRAKTLASGAAALPAHVSRWFRRLGLEILEDFGQTESTGVITMTEPGVDSAGTVGKPLPGMEIKIAEDGEVLARGRQVFKGYYKDDAATAQALEGGWLHTGDIGEINSKGQLVIRGRKKEVLKTSGGKMVAPLPIEEQIKTLPLISQACMVGDGRKYLAVLITLNEATLAELKSRPGALDGRTAKAPEIESQIKLHLDEINKKLASFEQVKRFAILSQEFSIAENEMTPTLKMKRMVIEKRYKDVIDSMYPSVGNGNGA